MWVSWIKNLRFAIIICGVANLIVVIVGGILVFVAFPSCNAHRIYPMVMVSLAAGIKIAAMVKTGIAQEATAKTILDSPAGTIIRNERQLRYRTWLWWTRFAVIIAFIQFFAATYLILNVTRDYSRDETSRSCAIGNFENGNSWKQNLLLSFMIMACFVPVLQCFIGSDVLKWRSFYATQDDVWKAHYQEVFDHSIREILCCFGRFEYLSGSDSDEVYLVARLLGDLVAYRASGTGHLELLAGLALLQKHSQTSVSYERFMEAPEDRLKEAATFHKFAEAAYTGPLLDVGRSAFLFPCLWLYRQGVFTPWTRKRRPVLDGDNWWRGHAAAFLKYINLSQDVLRRGRVRQKRREAAYFVLVLHHLRSVTIAVRGTETPEDLITDGLGRECILSADDLDGVINGSHIYQDVKQNVELSYPHYGHSGIVEAARELFLQIEGNPEDHDSKSKGFLSSLLGAGCECDGYSVRIVGHSLGGSIAALLGLRLYGLFPNLHVYAYGALPCVDSVIANACEEFVTSIVYDNEFSARLSVGSILRLRAAAITALSQDTNTDTALIFRLARRFLYENKHENVDEEKGSADYHSGIRTSQDFSQHICGGNKEDRVYPIWDEVDSRRNVDNDGDDDFINPFHEMADDVNLSGNPVSNFMNSVSTTENGSLRNANELFLPGLVIHLVPEQKDFDVPLWKSWGSQERAQKYNAFIANRESFSEIVVSPSMFLDHLPWRCYHAMEKVLEARNAQDASDESQTV